MPVIRIIAHGVLFLLAPLVLLVIGAMWVADRMKGSE
jgi:hypothetical protein